VKRAPVIYVRLVGWLLLVALAGCAPHGDACELPAQTTYDCRPTRDVVAGCVGGPQWANGQDDVDKTFPLGCGVSVPECSAVAVGNPRMFECTRGPDGKPDWYEPI
jgi:hypothetical protein